MPRCQALSFAFLLVGMCSIPSTPLLGAPSSGESGSLPWSREELHRRGPQKTYPADASAAAFVLGGIGTGNFSIGARGEFRDWELTYHPQKRHWLPYTFFSIWTGTEDGTTAVKVLESRVRPPFTEWGGTAADLVSGLPRFETSAMRGEYPFVWVDLKDSRMPVEVQLEAFTPFVPLDADASGIPAAVLRYKVRNTSGKSVAVSIAGSLANEACSHDREKAEHVVRHEEGRTGLFYACPDGGATGSSAGAWLWSRPEPMCHGNANGCAAGGGTALRTSGTTSPGTAG